MLYLPQLKKESDNKANRKVMEMNIEQLITEELIIFDETIRSKSSLFDCLGRRLEASGRVKNSKKIIKDFLKRENETSTGIEDGFGIPHAKVSMCWSRHSALSIAEGSPTMLEWTNSRLNVCLQSPYLKSQQTNI